MTTISARPHSNGNTLRDFSDAAIALSDALSDVHEALTRIRVEVMNGRNYQHLPGAEGWNARDADIAIGAKAMTAYCTLRGLEAAILQVVVDCQG